MKDPRTYCDICHRIAEDKIFKQPFDLLIHSNMNSQNPLHEIGIGCQYSEVEIKDACQSCLRSIGEAIVKTINKRRKDGI